MVVSLCAAIDLFNEHAVAPLRILDELAVCARIVLLATKKRRF